MNITPTIRRLSCTRGKCGKKLACIERRRKDNIHNGIGAETEQAFVEQGKILEIIVNSSGPIVKY